MRTKEFLTGTSIAAISQNQAASQEAMPTVTRDAVTVLLPKGIPAETLYDAIPYHIVNGHIATKLPSYP